MSDFLESLLISRLLDNALSGEQLEQLDPTLFELQRGTLEWVLAYRAANGTPPSAMLVRRRFPGWNPVDGTDTNDEVLAAIRIGAHRQRLEVDISEAIDVLYEGGPDAAVSYLSGKLLEYNRVLPDVMDLTDVGQRTRKYSARRKARETGVGLGIPTGFPTLDNWTGGGLQGGNYYIVLGDTNVGKTWFSLYLAVKAWEGGYSPLYVSLEGAGEEPGYRFDTLTGHLSNSKLYGGYTDVEDYRAHLETLDNAGRPFWLAVQGAREEYTPGALWTQVAAKRPDVIFIDYLTLMTIEGEDAEDWRTASRVSRILATSFANRLGIPVVANIQAARGARGKSTLNLDDAAIAYAIVRPADMVLGLTPITRGLKVELLKGRHTPMMDAQDRRAKFYTAVDWDIGEISEDKDILV